MTNLGIGIDPGTEICGYGIVLTHGGNLYRKASGIWTAKRRLPRLERIGVISRQMNDTLYTFLDTFDVGVDRIDWYIESQYSGINPRTGIALAQCAGTVVALYEQLCHDGIDEIAPGEWKKIISNLGFRTGGLDEPVKKSDVSWYIEKLLNYAPQHQDEADALAIACAGLIRSRKNGLAYE